MKDAQRNLLTRFRSYSLLLAGAWTVCVAASLLWNLHRQRLSSVETARSVAQVVFENDLLYRRWVAQQGGLYARVSPATPPNPYLDVPQRDVTTTTGVSLTLLNPAYLARLVNEAAGASTGSRGHITSLNPLRPENAPDPWEAGVLRSFEQGCREARTVAAMAGGEYLRLMRPFVTEPSCLGCHAAQGYQAGDIRGGISISVPMAPLRASAEPVTTHLLLAHAGLWLVGLVGVGRFRRNLVREVLAREQADVQLRRSAEELARSNRELEQFAYVVSHDLQEPLRMVTAFGSMLRERCQGVLDAKGEQYLGFTIEGAERMQALVRDLLAYARASGQSLELSPTAAQESLDAALADLRTSLEESGASVTHGPLPTVQADGQRLRQLFQNLIANAIKFRREGVRPEVHVSCRPVSRAECRREAAGGVACRGRGPREMPEEPERAGFPPATDPHRPNAAMTQAAPAGWLFSVRDNGIGIEPRHAEVVFQIFERLHAREQYPGTGIGLAICKMIVERHGGRIWMESTPGKGSTFFFTLPAEREPPSLPLPRRRDH